MKKATLAICLSVLLAACGSTQNAADSSADNSNQTTTAQKKSDSSKCKTVKRSTGSRLSKKVCSG